MEVNIYTVCSVSWERKQMCWLDKLGIAGKDASWGGAAGALHKKFNSIALYQSTT
jgi:hypothetical protein